jgi:hypothetical protein
MIGEGMDAILQLDGRRKALLAEMGTITHMRIGSISEQRQKTRLVSGKVKENGPYTVLTYRGPNGKTKTERILPEVQARVAEQVKNHARFKELTGEYVKLCDQMARLQDGDVAESERAKKN